MLKKALKILAVSPRVAQFVPDEWMYDTEESRGEAPVQAPTMNQPAEDAPINEELSMFNDDKFIRNLHSLPQEYLAGIQYGVRSLNSRILARSLWSWITDPHFIDMMVDLGWPEEAVQNLNMDNIAERLRSRWH